MRKQIKKNNRAIKKINKQWNIVYTQLIAKYKKLGRKSRTILDKLTKINEKLMTSEIQRYYSSIKNNFIKNMRAWFLYKKTGILPNWYNSSSTNLPIVNEHRRKSLAKAVKNSTDIKKVIVGSIVRRMSSKRFSVLQNIPAAKEVKAEEPKFDYLPSEEVMAKYIMNAIGESYE